MKKKILSFLLTFAMIFSMAAMFAGTVSAADETPTVTINTYEQLEAFIAGLATDDYADDYVVLGADMDTLSAQIILQNYMDSHKAEMEK